MRALWLRGEKFTKNSPKNIFVDELLSQLLTLCVHNGEVAEGMQVSLPRAGSAAQLEPLSCRYPPRQKASLER